MAMVSVMAVLILKGTGDLVLVVVPSLVMMASDLAIKPNLFTVVSWKMGAGAPLS